MWCVSAQKGLESLLKVTLQTSPRTHGGLDTILKLHQPSSENVGKVSLPPKVSLDYDSKARAELKAGTGH